MTALQAEYDKLTRKIDQAYEDRLEGRIDIEFFDRKAREWAAEKGYDPVFGARPLKRFLQRHLETRLARALIAGEIAEGTEVKFTVKGDELVMKGEK